MDQDHDPASEPRRAFLRRIGATFAAGVGLVAFGGSVAGARPAGTQSCVHYCRNVGCPGACPWEWMEFRCRNECNGSEYTTCVQYTCQDFCRDTVCV